MKSLILSLLLCATFALTQDTKSASNPKHDDNFVTVQGCVSRLNGDYVLMKEEPGATFELQGSNKIRLHEYLGQRVEVSGPQSPTLSTSSDAMNRTGSAAPVTITVKSIKTLDKQCPSR